MYPFRASRGGPPSLLSPQFEWKSNQYEKRSTARTRPAPKKIITPPRILVVVFFFPTVSHRPAANIGMHPNETRPVNRTRVLIYWML